MDEIQGKSDEGVLMSDVKSVGDGSDQNMDTDDSNELSKEIRSEGEGDCLDERISADEDCENSDETSDKQESIDNDEDKEETMVEPSMATSRSDVKSRIYCFKSRWPDEAQCEYCNNLLSSRLSAKKHMERFHARETMYKCEYCLYSVRKKSRLSRHVASFHTKETLYTTDFGVYKDAYVEGLNKRNKYLYGSNVYKKCTYCFFETNAASIRSHTLGVHKIKYPPYRCVYCKFKTSNLGELADHLSEHDHLKKYTCPFCVYRSMRWIYLKRHVKMAHRTKFNTRDENDILNEVKTANGFQVNSMSEDEEEAHKCETCGFFAKDRKTLGKHIIKMHSHSHWSVQKVPKPDVEIKNEDNLLVKNEETTVNDPNNERKDQSESKDAISIKEELTQKIKFVCSKCDFFTLYESLYNEHLACSHQKFQDTQLYTCEYCSFSSVYSHSVKRHYETVHIKIRNRRVVKEEPKVKTFECDYCTTIFMKKISLRRHVERVHDIDKPYNCHLCDYKAPKNEDLRRHMKLHT